MTDTLTTTPGLDDQDDDDHLDAQEDREEPKMSGADLAHGPSFNQLCEGLGWHLSRPLRVFVVQRLLANQWLTDTGPVPWTLRPGPAAHSRGIILPTARNPMIADRS